MANLVFDFLHHYQTGERRASDPADAYQYDEGHVMEAVVPVAVTSCEIHYWARGFDEAKAYTPASITQNTDNSYTITGNIPNKFFETYGDLRVYIVVTDGDASITTYEGRIHICERSKPDDYVDDDPENEATRVLTEAQEAAATATAAAQTAQDVADSIPADYSQMSEDVDTLKTDTNTLKDGLTAVESDVTDLKEDLSENVGDLKNALSIVVGETETDVNLNFDIVGYYKNGNLNNLDTDTADARSCIIEVNAGDKYKVSGQSQYEQKLACVYDANDNILLVIMPENSAQIVTEHEFSIPENGVKMSLSYLHNYPAYAVTLKKIETALKPIGAESLDIFETNVPVNLYDYTSATDGAYMNPNGSTTQWSDMCYAYVAVTPGTHVVHACYNFFGNPANRIPYFDANKQYINYLSGTKLTNRLTNLEVVSIDVPANAKYICLSNRVVYKNRVMAVKASAMPDKYSVYFTPYNALENKEKVNAENIKGADSNPLYLKTVAFDGDSICHGVSAADGKSGWAGRIGNANGMNWNNYGISGGTITNNHSHCILNRLNDIHNYMPTLDYYIFEGGTNDADHLGLSGIGTVTDDDYSGSYDTDTFSGAFETLIYNALTFYPTTKIGYIVAQKMGKTNNANYTVRKAFFDRAIEICKKWGVPYVDLWDGSHLNPNLDSMYDASMTAEENIAAGKMYIDGQHLTPTGYDYITPIIEAWMKTI